MLSDALNTVKEQTKPSRKYTLFFIFKFVAPEFFHTAYSFRMDASICFQFQPTVIPVGHCYNPDVKNEAMTTTWSFGLPANLPVMPPYLPFHGRRAVAVAEVMRTNASRGSVVSGQQVSPRV